MRLTVSIELTDAQLDAIAEKAAQRIGFAFNQPLTVAEAAQALRVSEKTIRRRIAAGRIKTVPEVGAVLVPPAEMRRLLGETPNPASA